MSDVNLFGITQNINFLVLLINHWLVTLSKLTLFMLIVYFMSFIYLIEKLDHFINNNFFLDILRKKKALRSHIWLMLKSGSQ